MVLEKTFEHPLDCKEIKPVNPKGSQSWIFIGRTDAEAETPTILWSPDVKNWLTGKDPYGGKDWRQEEKGQQRMRGLDGITNSRHKFEQDPGVGDGQGSLVCCSPWGRRVGHNWGAKLNWTALILAFKITSNSTCGANLVVLIWFFS